MRHCARRFRRSLFTVAILMGAGAQAALAQELQLDPKALDTKALDPSVSVKPKGKKARAAAPAEAASKPAAQQGGPNRQFGELEGWSPGKAPPKPKDKDDDRTPSAGKPPVSMTPSGNMGTGFTF